MSNKMHPKKIDQMLWIWFIYIRLFTVKGEPLDGEIYFLINSIAVDSNDTLQLLDEKE